MSDSDQPDPRPAYGDSHEERARELTETGSSVRRSGRGAFNDLRFALWPDTGRPAETDTQRRAREARERETRTPEGRTR